jgi:ketosteroid isomerase-like protein
VLRRNRKRSSLAVLALASGAAIAQEAPKLSTPSTPAASQPKFDYKPSPEEKELVQLSQEWMDAALRRKDEKRLRELMVPEFTLQLWDASRAPQPLEAWLATLKTRLDKMEFEYSGLNARIFGDVAVVYSRFWWKGTMNGKPFADSGFLTDVWVKKDGRWQVVARRTAPQQQIQEVLGLGNK